MRIEAGFASNTAYVPHVLMPRRSRGTPVIAAGRRLGEYLRARRSLVRPAEEQGAAAPRRVPGLRREEVASAAGISVDYYLRLEQGRGNQPSRVVLESLAQALQLDEFGRGHLFRLASLFDRPEATLPVTSSLAAETREMMAAVWQETPAFVVDRNQDVLASNRLAMALSPETAAVGNNLAIHTFRGFEGATGVEAEFWRTHAAVFAAALRYYGDPDDARFRDVVAALSEIPLFSQVWARHEVRPLSASQIRILLEPYGWLDFTNQVFEIPGVWGQVLVTYGWVPGSRTDEAMVELIRRLAADDIDDAVSGTR